MILIMTHSLMSCVHMDLGDQIPFHSPVDWHLRIRVYGCRLQAHERTLSPNILFITPRTFINPDRPSFSIQLAEWRNEHVYQVVSI